MSLPHVPCQRHPPQEATVSDPAAPTRLVHGALDALWTQMITTSSRKGTRAWLWFARSRGLVLVTLKVVLLPNANAIGVEPGDLLSPARLLWSESELHGRR